MDRKERNRRKEWKKRKKRLATQRRWQNKTQIIYLRIFLFRCHFCVLFSIGCALCVGFNCSARFKSTFFFSFFGLQICDKTQNFLLLLLSSYIFLFFFQFMPFQFLIVHFFANLFPFIECESIQMFELKSNGLNHWMDELVVILHITIHTDDR